MKGFIFGSMGKFASGNSLSSGGDDALENLFVPVCQPKSPNPKGAS